MSDEATWSYGLQLGMLYPLGTILENLREFAWRSGLEFEGYYNRGWFGSTVQIRVRGDYETVNDYANAVVNRFG